MNNQKQVVICDGKRLSYIDLAKFIGILFVVISHSGVGGGLSFDKWIHIFHMPLFFFISGFTFDFEKHSKDFKNFIFRRVKSLVIPYFCFSLIIYGLRLLLCALGIQQVFSFKTFIKTLLYDCCLDSLQGTIQWFIPSLLFTEVFALFSYVILSKQSEKYSVRMVVIGTVFGVFGFAYPHLSTHRLPMGLDVALVGVFFFIVGNITKHYNLMNYITRLSKSISLLFALLLLFFGTITGMHNGEISMRELIYGNEFLFIVSSLMIVLFTIVMCYYIDTSICNCCAYNGIIYLGQNTLVILLLNRVIILFVNVVLKKLNYSTTSYLVLFARPIIVLVVCYFSSKVIIAFFPFLLGRKNKAS